MTGNIKVLIAVVILLVSAGVLFAQNSASLPFAVPSGGSASFIAGDNARPLNIGFAAILPGSASVEPAGLGMLQLRQNNVLVGETTVPASELVLNDRFYVAVGGNVNTGVAIANPNSEAATISFGFQDPDIRFRGVPVNPGELTIPPNSQIVRFMNEPPFNGPAPYFGMMNVSSTLPIGIASFRGLANERSEFIVTAMQHGLPPAGLFGSVVLQPRVVAGYIPMFAAGGGWSTQLVVIDTNASDGSFGTFDFFDSSGNPVVVKVDGTSTASFDFSIGRGDLHRFAIDSVGADMRVGYIRITAAAHSARFESFAIVTHKQNGVTVSMACVPMTQSAAASRAFVEESTDPSGQLQTGIAINNDSANSVGVVLELRDSAGKSVGSGATILIPPFGQFVRFLRELREFASLPFPFRGTLRISTNASGGVSVASMRARSNERSEFLFSSLPLAVEQSTQPASQRVIPLIGEGGGYGAQLAVFDGGSGTVSNGSIVFVSGTDSPFGFSIQ